MLKSTFYDICGIFLLYNLVYAKILLYVFYCILLIVFVDRALGIVNKCPLTHRHNQVFLLKIT